MLRRRGVGLLGTAAVGGVAYAAGSHAARGKAQDEAQSQQIADLQAQSAPEPQPVPAAPPPPSTMDDRLSQLQQLADLQAAGVLTQEEVAIQKARILA